MDPFDVNSIAASPMPPDWAAIHTEISCPLCDYNLRRTGRPEVPGMRLQISVG